MFLGHGTLSSSQDSWGHRVSGGGCSPICHIPDSLSPPTAGATCTPMDLCEQTSPSSILFIVLQEQATGLLIECRLWVRVDQQALDGLWEKGLESGNLSRFMASMALTFNTKSSPWDQNLSISILTYVCHHQRLLSYYYKHFKNTSSIGKCSLMWPEACPSRSTLSA